METVWLLLGIVILGGTLLDVFLTALNYDEAGFLAGRATAAQWRVLRQVTRRLPRRWRPVGLRQVTGLQLVLVVVVWLVGVILGYGFIYRAQMTRGAFSVSGTGSTLDVFDAMYFSAAQLATVGGSALTAETDPLRFLSIAESLTGVVLVSLILTFLLGVYDVIGNLNVLCRQFATAERGAGSAVASLAPYFDSVGRPNGLDGHLDDVADAFTAYVDGLHLHHAAYYFQSGRDQFALPYALRMLGGTLGALRWGLPAGHPAAGQPRLEELVFEFLEFADYLRTTLRWPDLDVPEVVSADVFAAQVAAQAAGRGRGARRDPWVAAFLDLEAGMARLARVEPLRDAEDAYRRYADWLPFAFRAHQVTLAVSDDLDYQPVIGADATGTGPDPARTLEEDRGTPPRAGRLPGWLSRLGARLAQVDPGHARRRTATRAVLGAAAAFVSLHVLFDALGERAVPPAVFGGFVAMLSGGIAVDRTLHGRKLTSVLVVVPISAVVVVGALVSDTPALGALVLVLVALVGVAAGSYGARWGALGRVTFMAYYFALILRLDLDDVVWFVVAALVGAAWAYLLAYVLAPARPRAVLNSGVDAFGRQVVASVDTLVDAVSWARWDPDIRRRVALDTRRMHRGAAFLAGQLAGEPEASGLAPGEGARLRLAVFDTELAAVNLKDAARGVTGTSVSLELRGRLAGRLEVLQAHLQDHLQAQSEAQSEDRSGPGHPGVEAVPPWEEEPRSPEGWPPVARRLLRAVEEFHRAVATLLAWDASSPSAACGLAPNAEDDAALAALEQPVPDTDQQTGRPAGRRAGAATRQAVQAAIATGASLAVGAAVSGAHQYWATLAAFQVLGGTDGETLVKAVQRIVGTVAGAAVGFGVAIATGAPSEVMVPLLAVAVFASTYYRPVSRAAAAFWTTLIFAGIYEFLGRLDTVALELRILETVLGAAIALLVAWKVLPTHTRTKLDQDLGTLVTDVQVVVSGSLERLTGHEEITGTAVRDRLLALDGHARRINATAAPLRRSVGALEAGGIEAQLTAVWSLTHATRLLAHAVGRAVASSLDTTGPDWEEMRGVLEQNLGALSAVLAGRSAGRVPGELPVGSGDIDPGGSPAARELVAHVERINQTVVALLDDLSPDGDDGDDDGDARPGRRRAASR